jgi:hypothetical protein
MTANFHSFSSGFAGIAVESSEYNYLMFVF